MSVPESPRHPSQADEFLRRAIAAKPVTLPKLPSDLVDPVARRRGITVRGW